MGLFRPEKDAFLQFRVHFFTPVLKMPKMVLYRFPNLQGRSQNFWTGGRERAKRVRLARRRRFFFIFTTHKTPRRNLAIEFRLQFLVLIRANSLPCRSDRSACVGIIPKKEMHV